jgi:hypothetical protein
MTSACPIQGILKPVGWTSESLHGCKSISSAQLRTTTYRRQSPQRVPDSLRQQTAADAAAANSAPRADPLDRQPSERALPRLASGRIGRNRICGFTGKTSPYSL